MNPIWAPVIASAAAGALGLAAGLGGSWISHVTSQQREADADRRKLRDQRNERLRQTYLDMVQHLQNRRSWLNLITETRVEFSDRAEPHLSFNPPLAPRVLLYCSQPIVDAWNRYEDHAAAVKDAEFDGDLRGVPGGVNISGADVQAIEKLIDEITVMLRSAVEELERP